MIANLNIPPCPPPSGGVHSWTLAAANRCRIAGLVETDAERVITERMTRPPTPRNEIQSAVRKAYASDYRSTCTGPFVRPVAPLDSIKYEPAKLKTAAARVTQPVNWRHWLWCRSPKHPDRLTSFGFLKCLYEPGETVLVFDAMESARPVRRVQIAGVMDCRVLPHIYSGGAGGKGIWFLCNPVDGEYHPNPRNGGKLSCRSEESVTSFRYGVLESDQAPAHLWLAFLAQLPVRIAAIYTSGGRSIHALVRIDAATKEAFDAWAKPLKRPFKALGGDAGCLSAVRLTRLPGCWRPEKGSFQKLLYLNPQAPAVPLKDLPVLWDRSECLSRWHRPQETTRKEAA